MTHRKSVLSRKPLTVGSFFVFALLTVALFVPTFSAHLAVMNTVSIDGTPTDYALSEDGKRVVVDIRVRNPTRSEFTVSYAELYGKVDGTQVTGLGVEIEETRIASGETGTVTASIEIREGYRDRVADAVESGTLSVTGQLKGTIADADVEIEVTGGDDG